MSVIGTFLVCTLVAHTRTTDPHLIITPSGKRIYSEEGLRVSECRTLNVVQRKSGLRELRGPEVKAEYYYPDNSQANYRLLN